MRFAAIFAAGALVAVLIVGAVVLPCGLESTSPVLAQVAVLVNAPGWSLVAAFFRRFVHARHSFFDVFLLGILLQWTSCGAVVGLIIEVRHRLRRRHQPGCV